MSKKKCQVKREVKTTVAARLGQVAVWTWAAVAVLIAAALTIPVALMAALSVVVKVAIAVAMELVAALILTGTEKAVDRMWAAKRVVLVTFLALVSVLLSTSETDPAQKT